MKWYQFVAVLYTSIASILFIGNLLAWLDGGDDEKLSSKLISSAIVLAITIVATVAAFEGITT